MANDPYQPCSCGSGKKFKFCCYQKRKILDGISDTELITRSTEFPIHECYVSSDWQISGLAQIIVIRQLPNGKYLLGVYLVDVFCLGLKDTFIRTHLNEGMVDEILNQMPCGLDEVSYEDVRSIVLGAIDYAKNLGFEPDREWKRSGLIIESNRDFVHKFTFGKDGKPLFIQGPHDNKNKIMEKLLPLIKESKANFMTAADFEDLLENTNRDDDEVWLETCCDKISDLMECGNFINKCVG